MGYWQSALGRGIFAQLCLQEFQEDLEVLVNDTLVVEGLRWERSLAGRGPSVTLIGLTFAISLCRSSLFVLDISLELFCVIGVPIDEPISLMWELSNACNSSSARE